MSSFVIWLGAVLAIVVGSGKAIHHQIRREAAKCQCTCAPIYGEWPWVQDAIGVHLEPGETVRRHPWFIGGVILCTHDRRRFEAMQAAIDVDLAQRRKEGF